MLSLFPAMAAPGHDDSTRRSEPSRFDQRLGGKFVEAVGNYQGSPISARRARWQPSFKHPAAGAVVEPLTFSFQFAPISEIGGANRVDIASAPNRGRAPPIS